MDGSDTIIGLVVIALIVAFFWGLVIFGILVVGAVLGTLGLLLAPWFLYGFVKGLRERKAEDSNPRRRSARTG